MSEGTQSDAPPSPATAGAGVQAQPENVSEGTQSEPAGVPPAHASVSSAGKPGDFADLAEAQPDVLGGHATRTATAAHANYEVPGRAAGVRTSLEQQLRMALQEDSTGELQAEGTDVADASDGLLLELRSELQQRDQQLQQSQQLVQQLSDRVDALTADLAASQQQLNECAHKLTQQQQQQQRVLLTATTTHVATHSAVASIFTKDGTSEPPASRSAPVASDSHGSTAGDGAALTEALAAQVSELQLQLARAYEWAEELHARVQQREGQAAELQARLQLAEGARAADRGLGTVREMLSRLQ